MDFTMIGRVGSYARQQNLLFAANYRIKTGQSVVDDNGRLTFSKTSMFQQIAEANTQSKKQVNAAKLSSIKQKLASGRKLSKTELAYLRENDPKTYKKAKYADDAREELKSELKAAKTKSEARQAVMRAMVKVAAEASAEFEALKAGAAGGGGMADVGADSLNFSGAENSTEVNADSQSLLNVNTEMNADTNVEGAETSTETSANENVNAENSNADKNSAAQESPENGRGTGKDSASAAQSQAQRSNPNAENLVAQDDKSSVENEDEDWSPLDVLDKFIIAMRALQDEWLQFANSDEYKDLPEDILEEAEMNLAGVKKSRSETPGVQALEAIMAYKTAMNFSTPVDFGSAFA